MTDRSKSSWDGRSGERGGVGRMLDEGFRVSKLVFFRIWPFVLLANAPGLAALALGYVGLEDAPAVEIDVSRFVWTLSTAALAFVGCQAFFEPLSLAVTYASAGETLAGRAWSLATVVKATFARLWPVIVVGAVYYGTIYALMVLVVAGAAAVASAGFVAASGSLGLALLSMLGGGAVAAMAVVLALGFTLRYGLALPDLMNGPEGATMSRFGRSATLMHGGYVEAGLLFVVLTAIRFGVSMLSGLMVPTPAIRSLEPDAFYDVVPALVRLQLLQQIVGAAVAALFAIYANACWTVLYARRKRAVEGPAPPSLGDVADSAM